jgi:hypothetical protein
MSTAVVTGLAMLFITLFLVFVWVMSTWPDEFSDRKKEYKRARVIGVVLLLFFGSFAAYWLWWVYGKL